MRTKKRLSRGRVNCFSGVSRDFGFNWPQNASSERVGLKRFLIDPFKSYRSVYNYIKFVRYSSSYLKLWKWTWTFGGSALIDFWSWQSTKLIRSWSTCVTGQQFVEEVLDAQKAHCPPEYFNIPLPEVNQENTNLLRQEKVDLYEYRQRTKLDVLPFVRTRYDAASGLGPNNPRQQVFHTATCCNFRSLFCLASNEILKWSHLMMT